MSSSFSRLLILFLAIGALASTVGSAAPPQPAAADNRLVSSATVVDAPGRGPGRSPFPSPPAPAAGPGPPPTPAPAPATTGGHSPPHPGARHRRAGGGAGQSGHGPLPLAAQCPYRVGAGQPDEDLHRDGRQ